MTNLLQHFQQLFFLKAKAEDIPYSTGLFWLLVVSYCLCHYFFLGVMIDLANHDPNLVNKKLVTDQASGFQFFILERGLYFLFLYVLLNLSQKANRFVQTASNILGVLIIYKLVVTLFLLPLLNIDPISTTPGDQDIPLMLILLPTLLLPFSLWIVVIQLLVIQQAFECLSYRAVFIFLLTNLLPAIVLRSFIISPK